MIIEKGVGVVTPTPGYLSFTRNASSKQSNKTKYQKTGIYKINYFGKGVGVITPTPESPESSSIESSSRSKIIRLVNY